LIGILEELAIAPLSIPLGAQRGMIPVMFDIVSLWTRQQPDQPELGYARVSIISPSGESLYEHSSDVDLRQSKRLRAIGRLIGFPVRHTGIYRPKVERRASTEDAWEAVIESPLEITVDPALQAAPPSNGQNQGG
jgi:hypothetical protein